MIQASDGETAKRDGGLAAAVLLACWLVAGPAGADSGATALNFLRLDPGPRQVAMGGVVLSEDVYGMAYNPAWLGRIEAPEVGLSHASWLEDLAYQDVFYATRWRRGGLGFRLQSLSYGELEGYDATGAQTSSLSARDLLVAAAYGRHFARRRLALGLGLKWAQETIGSAKARALLFDAGALWRPWDEGRLEDVSVSAALRHLGPSARFDRTKEPTPRSLDLGAGVRLFEERLLAGLELRLPRDVGAYLDLGAEYWLIRQEVAVRAGFETGQDEGPGFRVGVGLRVGPGELNYAFLPMGRLGMTHHVGFSARFGGPPQKAFREGVSLMRRGRPAEAILKFEETLRLQPDHPRAGPWLRRAHRRIRELLEEGE